MVRSTDFCCPSTSRTCTSADDIFPKNDRFTLEQTALASRRDGVRPGARVKGASGSVLTDVVVSYLTFGHLWSFQAISILSANHQRVAAFNHARIPIVAWIIMVPLFNLSFARPDANPP